MSFIVVVYTTVLLRHYWTCSTTRLVVEQVYYTFFWISVLYAAINLFNNRWAETQTC
jgi:hypothetical protein